MVTERFLYHLDYFIISKTLDFHDVTVCYIIKNSKVYKTVLEIGLEKHFKNILHNFKSYVVKLLL